MDIKTLESFRLSDAISFHDELNPKLWNGMHLRPEVRKQLKKIADDFMDELGISGLDVVDVTVSGSNAAYSYTPHSDLDLHIIVDMSDMPDDEVYKELFNAKKNIYNDSHDITIHGVPIEVYVQDSREPVVSLGEYSIKDNDWIKLPTKRRANLDQTATKSKYNKLLDKVNTALKSNNLKKINKTIKKIRQYRQAGLDKGGEFGPENLAYKVLRSQGYINKLYQLRDKLHSEVLTIENMYQNPEEVQEAVGDNYLYHATQPAGMMRILRTGMIKASWRPQEATKARTQYPTVSTTRSKQYAESEDFVDFLNLPKEGNAVIIVFDRNAVANHYKMFSTSQGTQTVGDEYEEVIVVPKGAMPVKGTMKGFYFNPRRSAEIQEFQYTPWFKELLNSPYYMGPKNQNPEKVQEGTNDYLWHGSKSEHKILYPRQAVDTGGAEGSNKNAVYATPNAKFAIAMGLTTPGSDTGMFPNDSQMVLFSGNIRKGQMVYLHKVPKDLFIKHNGREWYSKPEVKEVTPIEVVAVPVDKWLHLIRQATPQDWELRKKYMKEQDVDEAVHPDVTSKKYFIEPTENVGMGDFEFNARTFTGGLGDPNARGLQIRAYDPKHPKGYNTIGNADFIVKTDKKGNTWLESDETEVADAYRGKGVAAMMYAFAKSLGNDIKPSPYQSQMGRQMWGKWGKDAKHLAKEDVVEGLENYEGMKIKFSKDSDGVAVKALSDDGNKVLASVELFFNERGQLEPQDLWTNDRYQGQGIAKAMYDFLKNKGYTIIRSWDQTDAGKGFWDKHKGPEVNVWEDETLQYASEKTAAVNPYGGIKDRQFRGGISEASGYIPSEKEKNDPRFKTALTVDVKPDSIKKNAKAFYWKTSRAGIPPNANPNGKF